MSAASPQTEPRTEEAHPLERAATTFERQYAIRGDYQRSDTHKTLREGLAEYYRVNPGLLEPEGMDDEFSAHYFHCHDTTHVIFGTHTGPLDEGVNDVFTMFGVDVSYLRYLRGFFKTTGAGAVAKDYKATTPLRVVVTAGIGTLRVLPRVWRTCRAMHKKWPWDPPPGALDRPLAESRREYGIEVWRPEVVLALRQDR